MTDPLGGGGRTDPEITGFTFTPASGLRVGASNAAVDAVAGTFSNPSGGTGAFTYTLAANTGNDADNGSFEISGTDLKIKTALTAAGDKKIYVRITDSKGKTFGKALTIPVLAADAPYPDITGFDFTQSAFTTAEGTAGAVVGTFSNPVDGTAPGGTAPFTYSITGGADQANFEVDGTSLKAKNALAENRSGYNVQVTITDSAPSAKTYQKTLYIPIFSTDLLRGTITFTGIGTTPVIQYVEIEAYTSSGGWLGSGGASLGAVSGGTAAGTWVMPLDQPFTGSKDIHFELIIHFTDDTYITKDVTKTVSASNLANIDLGQISAAAITLSGTLGTVSMSGPSGTTFINSITLAAYDGNTRLGGKNMLSSGGTWSIAIEPLSSSKTVTFKLDVNYNSGSSQVRNYTIPGKNVAVHNTPVTGIALDAVAITVKEIAITLSGFPTTGTVWIHAVPASYTTVAAANAGFVNEAYARTITSTNTTTMLVPGDAPALYFYVVDADRDAADGGEMYKTTSLSSDTAVTLTKSSMTSIGNIYN